MPASSKRPRDPFVDFVTRRRQFERREEHPCHSPLDVLTATLPRIRFLPVVRSGWASPDHCMRPRRRRAGEPLADRLEHLGLAEVGNEQTEDATWCRMCRRFRLRDVATGAGTALHQPFPLKLAHRPPNGNARHAERLDQRSFAGEAIPRIQRSILDVAKEPVVDLLVFRNGAMRGRRCHTQMI